EIELGELVELRVSAGDAVRRKEAESLRMRWLAEGAPVLQRAGVSDLAALEALVKRTADATRRIEAGRREIAALHERAGSRDARVADLEPTVQSLRDREEALAGLDRVALERAFAKLGDRWEPAMKALEAGQERALEAARASVAASDR